jgi:hypothetical protein
VTLLLGLKLRTGAGAAHQLTAATLVQLHVVDRGARRDVLQGQRVTGLDVGFRTRLDHVAHGETLGCQDVALLPIRIVKQSDARRAVGVVLDLGDLGRHAVLVTLEVDDPIPALVTAALVASGDTTIVVAATLALERSHERAFGLGPREVVKRLRRHETAAG